MSGQRYVARSSELAARVLGGETIIMSARDSTVFSLNEVATVLWEAADGATPLEEIVANRICAEFEVTPEVALQDVESLVAELVGHGVLLVSDQPIAKTGKTP